MLANERWGKMDTPNERKEWYKNKKSDQIWWIDNPNVIGVWEFSFDKKTVFNMFQDYPYKLTKKQKELFDKENPFWADFFKERSNG